MTMSAECPAQSSCLPPLWVISIFSPQPRRDPPPPFHPILNQVSPRELYCCLLNIAWASILNCKLANMHGRFQDFFVSLKPLLLSLWIFHNHHGQRFWGRRAVKNLICRPESYEWYDFLRCCTSYELFQLLFIPLPHPLLVYIKKRNTSLSLDKSIYFMWYSPSKYVLLIVVT